MLEAGLVDVPAPTTKGVAQHTASRSLDDLPRPTQDAKARLISSQAYLAPGTTREIQIYVFAVLRLGFSAGRCSSASCRIMALGLFGPSDLYSFDETRSLSSLLISLLRARASGLLGG